MNSPDENFASRTSFGRNFFDRAFFEPATVGDEPSAADHLWRIIGAGIILRRIVLPAISSFGRSVSGRSSTARTAWAVGTDVTGSLQSLLGTVVIAVFVITFVVQAFQIPSPSMENTLLVGDYLLVNKLCYGGGGVGDYFMPYRRVQRGDIVVFHYPVNPAQHFVKRVIGVPGDRVRLVNKQVFVNGVPLKEPYAHFSRPADDLFRDNFPRLDVTPGRHRSGGCSCANWWRTDS